jgi:hypothetical protein
LKYTESVPLLNIAAAVYGLLSNVLNSQVASNNIILASSFSTISSISFATVKLFPHQVVPIIAACLLKISFAQIFTDSGVPIVSAISSSSSSFSICPFFKISIYNPEEQIYTLLAIGG